MNVYINVRKRVRGKERDNKGKELEEGIKRNRGTSLSLNRMKKLMNILGKMRVEERERSLEVIQYKKTLPFLRKYVFVLPHSPFASARLLFLFLT